MRCFNAFLRLFVPHEPVVEPAVGGRVAAGGQAYGRVEVGRIVGPLEVEAQ